MALFFRSIASLVMAECACVSLIFTSFTDVSYLVCVDPKYLNWSTSPIDRCHRQTPSCKDIVLQWTLTTAGCQFILSLLRHHLQSSYSPMNPQVSEPSALSFPIPEIMDIKD